MSPFLSKNFDKQTTILEGNKLKSPDVVGEIEGLKKNPITPFKVS